MTADIVRLASRYGRYGYRRITAMLRSEGWTVNAKRIWRRERLKVPQKQPKKGWLWLNDGSCVRLRPEHPNHVWRGAIVNNESSEILRMMNSGFDILANASVDLYPVDLRDGIDASTHASIPR